MAKYSDCFDYVHNIYYRVCDLYDKENITLKRLMRVIYYFDKEWLRFAIRPYIWEDYLLFNNQEFFESIPNGTFDEDRFCKIDHDIIDRLKLLAPTLLDLDSLPYVDRINHKEEIAKYVSDNCDVILDAQYMKDYPSMNIEKMTNIRIDYYVDQFETHFYFFYNMGEYRAVLNDLIAKHRSIKLGKI